MWDKTTSIGYHVGYLKKIVIFSIIKEKFKLIKEFIMEHIQN